MSMHVIWMPNDIPLQPDTDGNYKTTRESLDLPWGVTPAQIVLNGHGWDLDVRQTVAASPGVLFYKRQTDGALLELTEPSALFAPSPTEVPQRPRNKGQDNWEGTRP